MTDFADEYLCNLETVFCRLMNLLIFNSEKERCYFNTQLCLLLSSRLFWAMMLLSNAEWANIFGVVPCYVKITRNTLGWLCPEEPKPWYSTHIFDQSPFTYVILLVFDNVKPVVYHDPSLWVPFRHETLVFISKHWQRKKWFKSLLPFSVERACSLPPRA